MAHNILGQKENYGQGIWYNSAKFFSIDFHTYGALEQNNHEAKEFFYQVPGENKSIRIAYRNGIVTGIQTLGMRFKQDVCQAWIGEQARITKVIDNIGCANFDPEFFPKYIDNIQTAFRQSA